MQTPNRKDINPLTELEAALRDTSPPKIVRPSCDEHDLDDCDQCYRLIITAPDGEILDTKFVARTEDITKGFAPQSLAIDIQGEVDKHKQRMAGL